MSGKKWIPFLVACVFLAAGSRAVLSGAPDSAKTNAGQIAAEKTDVVVSTASAKADAGEIIFEMKYRGLTGAKGDLQLASYSSFGSADEARSPFTQSLNLPKGKGIYGTLACLQTSDGKEVWSALEVDGDKSVAFYVDLDRDGKLSPNEKILRSKEKSPMGEGVLYVTPDFRGKGSPYRVFLIDQLYRAGNGKVEHTPWFGPACRWEGTGTIDGTLFRLILFDDDNQDGRFARFGQDSYALVLEAEYLKGLEKGERLHRERFSRLIPAGKQFYELRVETTADGAQPARVVLRKREIPWGKITLDLKGTEGMKVKMNSVFLRGRERDVFFDLAGPGGNERELPIGSYQLERGAIGYGSARPNEWQARFRNGSEMTVVAGAPCVQRLGQPKLTPAAMKEQDRYSPNAKPTTVFEKSDNIYCFLEVKGLAGEKYGFFYQPSVGPIPEPQVRILDANGKEVASASMEYG